MSTRVPNKFHYHEILCRQWELPSCCSAWSEIRRCTWGNESKRQHPDGSVDHTCDENRMLSISEPVPVRLHQLLQAARKTQVLVV